jgi:hypothetical protein
MGIVWYGMVEKICTYCYPYFETLLLLALIQLRKLKSKVYLSIESVEMAMQQIRFVELIGLEGIILCMKKQQLLFSGP